MLVAADSAIRLRYRLFHYGFRCGCVPVAWFSAFLYSGVVVGLALLMSRLLSLYWPQGILSG